MSIYQLLDPARFPINSGIDTDTAETVHISSLALLKMLKHGRAGVPMEVMGLMLGEFIDDYTVHCVDVFAMPQSGTGVSVEAVDPVFQAKMIEMIKQTNRHEAVIGWYHSHPGFGCWLSGVDMNTQQSFEQLHPRSVAVVVDPIQSVRGKVVIDAFRLFYSNFTPMGQDARQTTSNVGHIQKPSIQALIHGLNRHYYSLVINYRKNELEQRMLTNLHKMRWTDALMIDPFDEHAKRNQRTIADLLKFAQDYKKAVQEQDETQRGAAAAGAAAKVGKLDPKRHLETNLQNVMASNIIQCTGAMIKALVV